MAKSKKQIELEQQVGELTVDLQRTRADFENYRKRADLEKTAARQLGQEAAIAQLLPVIDNIERAISNQPKEIKDNAWVQGVASLTKNLDAALDKLGVKRIDAKPGIEFNPDLHEAIQFDEDSTGDKEVITEVLQAGYNLNGKPIRPAIVRVARR